MGITVVRPHELGLSEIAVWHAMQRSTPSLGNPFLSPEFVIAAGRVKPSVRVAVLTDGPSLVGFFPFERRALGVGVPVAAGLTDCQGLVHAPGVDWDAQELLRACRLSVWQFDHLVDGQGAFEAHRSAIVPSPVIDLSDGFDVYFKRFRTQAPSVVRTLRRGSRNLEREAGPIRFELGSADPSALRLMMRWKSDQYRRTGRPDRFAKPWVVELVESLAATRTDGFSGLLSVLYAGETQVAADFNPCFDSVLAGWFTAYNPAFAKHSPGVLQLMRLIESCAARGIRLIDLGKGAKWYKEEVKTGEIFVSEGIVTRRSALMPIYWARTVPMQGAMRAIRANPRLFQAADWALKRYGHLRGGGNHTCGIPVMHARAPCEQQQPGTRCTGRACR